MRTSKIIDKFKIKGTKTFKKRPDSCPYCQCEKIHEVEILGAYNGALMWECDYCHTFLLRFTSRTTEKHLQKAKNLLIDVSNWEEIWEQQPN